MNRHNPRRTALQAALALGASLLVRPAQACEYYSTHLRITHPWTRATAPGATTAVVCMKFDEVTRADRLIAVQTPVASGAELMGLAGKSAVDLLIPEGQETVLDETGIHLRLVGLKLPLEVARSYPLLLVFEQGGTVQATLNIDYSRFG